MGAWGSGLYANDTTCDVRDAYMKLLQEQLSNEDAYAQILTKFADYIDDPDDAPLFWFALADTQWKAGRLLPEVKSKALDWIDKGGGLSLWEESESGGAGWRKTLDKLRAKLETEQPKEKRIRKPVKIESNLWNDGDVYAYLFHKEFDGRFGAPGKYMVLHKMGVEHQYYGDSATTVTYMIVRAFDKLFDELPTLLDLQGVRLLPFSHPYREQELQMQTGLTLYKKKDYPAEYLTFLGNIPVPEYTPLSHGAIRVGMLNSSSSTWFNINHWSYYFNQWQGIEYEIDINGEFKHTQRRIISCKLAHALYPLSYIHAFWLEGADATGSVDEYSDLDFWVDFEDEYEEQAIAAVENALSEIAEIDYKHIMRHEHPKIRQRIYHLAGTSEYLMIDFCWQLHSRRRDEYLYQENDPIETARIIFDKAGVIEYKPIDLSKFTQLNASQLEEAKYRRTQYLRAEKYVRRGLYLEAYAYYNRYVLEPLIDLLRLIHTPAYADWYMVHISGHIPKTDRERLEFFAQVSSLDDIDKRIPLAGKWFDELVEITEKRAQS